MKTFHVSFGSCLLAIVFALASCSGQAQQPADAAPAAAPSATAGAEPGGPVPREPGVNDGASANDPARDPADRGRNWLSFGAGTIVVDKTSQSRTGDSGARQLIDESAFTWQTGAGEVTDQSVTLELPARTTFASFVIDTGSPTYLDGSSAKDVTIAVSDTSATEGFRTVVEATLRDSSSRGGMDGQAFEASEAVPARWVRYTARNNFGSSRFILTKELSGYGTQETREPIPSVSGTYRMESIGLLHLKQDGNAIIGCYAEDEGIVEGTIDGRTMTLVASGKRDRDKGGKGSFVAVNVVDAGKTLLSTWWGWSAKPVTKAYDRYYVGKKTSDEIGNCAHLANLDGSADVVKDAIEQALEEDGKAVLYGINFDFDSDVIRPESKPTLDKVSAILKGRTDWTFAVEGHTDNIGGQAFNQRLSERRAASVVAYLTSAGIDGARLASSGYGFARPIAPNDSEAERAQNRRVELIRK